MTNRPSQSVDVPAAHTGHVEGRASGAVGLVPTAALVFGGIMWIATAYVGLMMSESKGIALSWIAIFPTVFGFVARAVRRARLEAGKSAVGFPFLVGAAAGLSGSFLLWLFFEGIWPSL